MKRILVPTDFSPTAEKAFRVALDIATRSKSEVIIYHTYIPVESTFVGSEETRKQYNTESETAIIERLQRLKQDVTGDITDVAVSTIVGRSPLYENMFDFAKDSRVDLIIMGTQGASGLKKVTIGSVAASVIEQSDLPVLLVPAKYEFQTPTQFAFATNFQPSDKQALTLVNALAKLYDADVSVLHFLNTKIADSEKEKNNFDTYASSLQSHFTDNKMKFHLMETSSVVETLENLDSQFPFDIMVLVRRKKTFFEKYFIRSLTANMAYITMKPLLIVPETD